MQDLKFNRILSLSAEEIDEIGGGANVGEAFLAGAGAGALVGGIFGGPAGIAGGALAGGATAVLLYYI